MSERLLSSTELAERLGVERNTVAAWYRKGAVPGLKLGTGRGARLRFRLPDVLAALGLPTNALGQPANLGGARPAESPAPM